MKRAFAAGAVLSTATALTWSQQSALQIDWTQSPVNGLWYGADFVARNWTQGETLSNVLGGHLATIRNQEEQNWIEAALAAYNDQGLMVGLNDVALQGVFQWSSGVDPEFFVWASGEPSVASKNNGVSLVEVDAAEAWRWIDGPTSMTRRPLVEVAGLPQTGWSWPRSTPALARPGWGCAADLDGDGDLDYASPNAGGGQGANHATITIHWNVGEGVLSLGSTIELPADPRVSTSIDLGGDLDLDLAVSCMGQVVVLENLGSGLFGAPVSVFNEGDSAGLAAADIDGDRFEDLLVADQSPDGPLRILFGQPDGTLAAEDLLVGIRPRWVAAADLNGDGAADVIASSPNSGARVRIYLNDGAGDFGPGLELVSSNDPMQPLPVDLDVDGDLDLVVPMADSSRLSIWLNDGSGHFQVVPDAQVFTANTPQDVDAADIDGDGSPDLVVPHWDGAELRAYLNDGHGHFQSFEVFADTANAVAVVLDDLDGDGVPDLIAARRLDDELRYWINHRESDCNGNGTPDSLEIAMGIAQDCDGNGTIDSCEVASGSAVDQDGNGIPDVCAPAPLASGVTKVSMATGGAQPLTLTAGSALGLNVYFLLGSASGTSPGIMLDGLHLPLQIADPYFHLTLTQPNQLPLVNTLGFLSPSGTAMASIVVPLGQPTWVGLTLHHAYVVFGDDLGVAFASNALPLAFVP
jgi:hypothetical protein